MVKDALQTSVALMRLHKRKRKTALIFVLGHHQYLLPPPPPTSLGFTVFSERQDFLCSFTTINTGRVSAEVFRLGSDVQLMKAIAAAIYTTAS